jgi:beta-phosphoglucomutase
MEASQALPAAPPQAVLFDFDGVLVDSEELHMRAYLQTAAKYGVPLTRDQYFRELIGFDDRGAWSFLFKENGRALDAPTLDEVIRDKLGAMRRIMREAPFRPLPGVADLLAALARQRLPMGICTGALREEVHTMLDGIGLGRFFTAVVCAEDVAVGKPDPAGYRLTARLLSEKIGRPLLPGQCLVVEDAPSVIRAVRAAGFWTLGVATTYPPQQLADAHWVVQTLEPHVVGAAIAQLRLG